MNRINYGALFNKDGNWIETEMAIHEQDIPVEILNLIQSDYANSKITEIEEITTAMGSKEFEIEILQNKKEVELRFNMHGKRIDSKNDEDFDEIED